MVQTTGEMSSVEYELLTKSIYDALLHADGIDTVDVKHNTDILGRSGCLHQIDVYWTFRLGGVEYRTAIECKNYASTLEIGRVRDFYGVLADLGNTQGIMITPVGFQSGAKRFADFYGINILELRTPTEGDWASKIKTVVLTIHSFASDIVKIGVTLDDNWRQANADKLSPDWTLQFAGMNNEVGLLDKNGKLVRSFKELQEKLPLFRHASESPDKIFEERIPTGGLYISDAALGLIPVHEMQISYKVQKSENRVEISGEQIVHYILRDLKENKVHTFQAAGGQVRVVGATR